MEDDILGKRPIATEEVSSFIAQIRIPVGVDRKEFISYCYATATAFIKSVDNQFESAVLIDLNLLHKIEFPNTEDDYGSLVQCVIDPIYGNSKIVAVFNDSQTEQEIFEENQWRVIKRNGETFIDLDAKANSGELNFTVHSGGYENIVSSFRFLNNTNKAKLNLLVQGNLDVDVDDTFNLFVQRGFKITAEDIDNNEDAITEIGYIPGVGFNYLDEFENDISFTEESIALKNKTGEEFLLDSKGFVYKNSKADLKQIILDSLDALMQSIVQTPAGPGSFDAGTISKFNKAKSDVNNLFK